MTHYRTFAITVVCCSSFAQGCATRMEDSSTVSAVVPQRVAPTQADFDREETAARAQYSASVRPLAADSPASAHSDAEAKEAAYFRAVERSMEFCRTQAELASHYFTEAPRAIYIDAEAACRSLRGEGIKAEVGAVIEGGTHVLMRAGAADGGKTQNDRDRSFHSYVARYGACRRDGLSHDEALVTLERSSAP